MDSERIIQAILDNASEIERLRSRIRSTFKLRDESPQKREEWGEACAEFHTRYDALAFPGGYEDALERIISGDLETMETAICFLECRPYFFRSGYMFNRILKRCRRAPLLPQQRARFDAVIQKYDEWRLAKK